MRKKSVRRLNNAKQKRSEYSYAQHTAMKNRARKYQTQTAKLYRLNQPANEKCKSGYSDRFQTLLPEWWSISQGQKLISKPS